MVQTTQPVISLKPGDWLPILNQQLGLISLTQDTTLVGGSPHLCPTRASVLQTSAYVCFDMHVVSSLKIFVKNIFCAAASVMSHPPTVSLDRSGTFGLSRLPTGTLDLQIAVHVYV